MIDERMSRDSQFLLVNSRRRDSLRLESEDQESGETKILSFFQFEEQTSGRVETLVFCYVST